MAGAFLGGFPWAAIPACALVGTGAGLWDYQANRDVSIPTQSELNLNPIYQLTEEQKKLLANPNSGWSPENPLKVNNAYDCQPPARSELVQKTTPDEKNTYNCYPY